MTLQNSVSGFDKWQRERIRLLRSAQAIPLYGDGPAAREAMEKYRRHGAACEKQYYGLGGCTEASRAVGMAEARYADWLDARPRR